jgi:hypothetical protein
MTRRRDTPKLSVKLQAHGQGLEMPGRVHRAASKNGVTRAVTTQLIGHGAAFLWGHVGMVEAVTHANAIAA